MEKLILTATAVLIGLGVIAGPQIASAGTEPITAAPTPTATQTPAQTRSTVILDRAGILPGRQSELQQNLNIVAAKSHLVFVVETLNTLNGQSIESYSLNRANQLGVGDKTLNNGVLIVVSKDDRKVRFQLGRGVSEKVSDPAMQNIVNNVVVPQFKNGNYYQGVLDGATSLGEAYTPGSSYVPAQTSTDSDNPFSSIDSSFISTIVFAFAGIVGAVVAVSTVGLVIGGIRSSKQEKEEAEQKKAAEKFWDGLDAKQQRKIASAPTREKKEQYLRRYGADESGFASSSTLLNLLLLSSYASMISHPSAPVQYSSGGSYNSSSNSSSDDSRSSSSSSSWSSPTTSYDSSSSFGGGGFDGGGATGSW